MTKSNKKEIKRFIITNIILMVMLVNLVVLLNVLEFGKASSYMYGMISGVIVGWAVYVVSFIRAYKKKKYTMDERTRFIIQKSGFYAFFTFYFIVVVFAILTRATNIDLDLTVKGLTTLATNVMFALYGIYFAILSKRY